jgi:hypothetical protein
MACYACFTKRKVTKQPKSLSIFVVIKIFFLNVLILITRVIEIKNKERRDMVI